jgi:hypothetical protein
VDGGRRLVELRHPKRHGAQTEQAAEAMKHDGVRPETILVLDEG